MFSDIEYLNRANEVLSIIKDHGVCSEFKDKRINRFFNKVRQLTNLQAQSLKMIAPAMTACIATTYFNIGLCQELAQEEK